jgi:hypothetical protein
LRRAGAAAAGEPAAQAPAAAPAAEGGPAAAAPLAGVGWSVVGEKRSRSEALAPPPPPPPPPAAAPAPAAASAAPSLSLEDVIVLFASRPAPPDVLSSKPAAAAAKRLAHEQSCAARDTFASRKRSGQGFARTVPPDWAAFVLARFRHQRELLLHFWNAARGATAAAADDAQLERARRLARTLEADYDELEALKARVLRDGAGTGPAATGSAGAGAGAGAGASASAAASARLASEIVELLTMLQGPVERALGASARL